jgi:hypothetical protein
LYIIKIVHGNSLPKAPRKGKITEKITLLEGGKKKSNIMLVREKKIPEKINDYSQIIYFE